MLPPDLLTPAQMQKADDLARAAGISDISLIRVAGAHVAAYVMAQFSMRPVLVLCGPGNNGADGVMAAQILKARGWPVRIALSVPREDTKGALRFLLDEHRGAIESFENLPIAKDTLVIDAVFGAGFRAPLSDFIGFVFDRVRMANCPVVAVDVPSGVNGRSGEADAKTLAAQTTITFFRAKPAHLLYPAKALCGAVQVQPIGIPDAVFEHIQPNHFINGPALWEARLPHKEVTGHKYDSGHLAVLGGTQMTGAATLAALAGLRTGAGLVTIVAPKCAQAVYQTQDPSLLVERKAFFASRFVRNHFADPRRTALVIGPGAGNYGARALRHMTLDVLAAKKPVVIDASALTAFAGHKAALIGLGHSRAVFTPHDGEFARLFPDLAGSRIDRARDAAEFLQSVVVLKGPDTIIAAPGGWCVINPNGCPHLSTAGAGDVLSGMIGGLLAQGMDAFEAACAAVYQHAEKAWTLGAGLIASDLLRQ